LLIDLFETFVKAGFLNTNMRKMWITQTRNQSPLG